MPLSAVQRGILDIIIEILAKTNRPMINIKEILHNVQQEHQGLLPELLRKNEWLSDAILKVLVELNEQGHVHIQNTLFKLSIPSGVYIRLVDQSVLRRRQLGCGPVSALKNMEASEKISPFIVNKVLELVEYFNEFKSIFFEFYSRFNTVKQIIQNLQNREILAKWMLIEKQESEERVTHGYEHIFGPLGNKIESYQAAITDFSSLAYRELIAKNPEIVAKTLDFSIALIRETLSAVYVDRRLIDIYQKMNEFYNRYLFPTLDQSFVKLCTPYSISPTCIGRYQDFQSQRLLLDANDGGSGREDNTDGERSSLFPYVRG